MRKKQNRADASNDPFPNTVGYTDAEQSEKDTDQPTIPRSLLLVNQLLYITEDDDQYRSDLLQLRH